MWSFRTWRRLQSLTFRLIDADAREDQTEVDAIHQQMHDLDPQGRYFTCEDCPVDEQERTR